MAMALALATAHRKESLQEWSDSKSCRRKAFTVAQSAELNILVIRRDFLVAGGGMAIAATAIGSASATVPEYGGVDAMPNGLTMAPHGLIAGKISRAGEYHVRLTAENKYGTARRNLRLMAGNNKPALVPPMG